jgi:hypothetical protein
MNPPDTSHAFGDPFRLEDLPLPRQAGGYAVQYLGRDHLLDRESAVFLPVRDPRLRGLFSSFAAAERAARAWLDAQDAAPPLAIVPAAFDGVLKRHVLIYGVLLARLAAEETAGWLSLTA